ncbi:MAG: hypothetical protein UX89_C0004G0035 [Parcubacteria group bacterium GW2011_GWA2_47_16]|nr:MAG: hypothetical protein UX89_C0004G0035 [Parcubacteria group bacterium GW2011_GWA2_47_16]
MVIDDVEIGVGIRVKIVYKHRRVLEQYLPVFDMPPQIGGHKIDLMRQKETVENKKKRGDNNCQYTACFFGKHDEIVA